MTYSITELAGADWIMITGSNTTEQHPVSAGKILDAVRKGADLIVFAPRRIQLSPYAPVHLAQKPGADVAYINALAKVVIDEGLFDREFVTSRTEGFADLKRSLDGCTPEWASEITGIPAEDRKSTRLNSSHVSI